jgi:hypothetical protein
MHHRYIGYYRLLLASTVRSDPLLSPAAQVSGTDNNGGAVFVDEGSTASFTSCTFTANVVTGTGARYGGGAVFVEASGSATFVGCIFTKPTTAAAGQNDVGRCTAAIPSDYCDDNTAAATVRFACPPGSTGAAVSMSAQDLLATQLPPTKQVVSCTPGAALGAVGAA